MRDSVQSVAAPENTWPSGQAQKIYKTYISMISKHLLSHYRKYKEGRKELGFTSLSTAYRSYRDEIETRNREEIPYSSQIVPRGLSANTWGGGVKRSQFQTPPPPPPHDYSCKPPILSS